MMRLLIALLALCFSHLSQAASTSISLDKANYDLSDKASLQNGAKLYMNYCFGCHSMGYQRYNRVAKDLDIPISLMEEHLIFTDAKSGELMKNAASPGDISKWFGGPAPDLTLVARVRGADWIYTYLRSFYQDDNRPFGVNNAVFPSVGMPHVLQELQGVPRKTFETQLIDGEEQAVYLGIKSDGSGELSEDEYDQAVLDLVNYLVYSGEPVRLEREKLGFWVLGFIVIFFIISYLLKREYWRDVH